MHPDAVYQYPIWAVGFLVTGIAVAGAVLVELAVRRFTSVDIRRMHNDVAAAMFSIIGVTFAVLLAFVAMLAWQGFNLAKAASYKEAAQIMDVSAAIGGLPEPAASALHKGIVSYTREVIDTEWPAQALGRTDDAGAVDLMQLNRIATGLHPAAVGDSNFHAALLQALSGLRDARAERLLSAESAVPPIVWFTLILGGVLTVASASFLGAPSLRMQLAMSSALAVCGALVLILIIALSNPFRGDFRVSTAPFDRVLAQIDTPDGRP